MGFQGPWIVWKVRWDCQAEVGLQANSRQKNSVFGITDPTAEWMGWIGMVLHARVNLALWNGAEDQPVFFSPFQNPPKMPIGIGLPKRPMTYQPMMWWPLPQNLMRFHSGSVFSSHEGIQVGSQGRPRDKGAAWWQLIGSTISAGKHLTTEWPEWLKIRDPNKFKGYRPSRQPWNCVRLVHAVAILIWPSNHNNDDA